MLIYLVAIIKIVWFNWFKLVKSNPQLLRFSQTLVQQTTDVKNKQQLVSRLLSQSW